MEPVLHHRHCPHPTMGHAATRSPTANPSTLSPIATTRPENSWPMMTGAFTPVKGCAAVVGIYKGPPRYSCKSVPQMPHQATSTCTCPGAGAGGSCTSSTRTSLCPCHTAAFMFPPLKIPLNKGGKKPKASGGCPVSQRGQTQTRQPPRPKGLCPPLL